LSSRALLSVILKSPVLLFERQRKIGLAGEKILRFVQNGNKQLLCYTQNDILFVARLGEVAESANRATGNILFSGGIRSIPT